MSAAGQARSLVPLIHVTDVARSVAFYRQLGFEVYNSFVPDGQRDPVWVYLVSHGAQLMVAAADAAVNASVQAVLLYLYHEDVTGFRQHLVETGVSAGPMKYPFYAPRGEFRLEDPDGFVIMVTHT